MLNLGFSNKSFSSRYSDIYQHRNFYGINVYSIVLLANILFVVYKATWA